MLYLEKKVYFKLFYFKLIEKEILNIILANFVEIFHKNQNNF